MPERKAEPMPKASPESDQALIRAIAEILNEQNLAEIEIERSQSELRVILHTARPGLVIGRKGEPADASERANCLTEELRRNQLDQLGEHPITDDLGRLAIRESLVPVDQTEGACQIIG